MKKFKLNIFLLLVLFLLGQFFTFAKAQENSPTQNPESSASQTCQLKPPCQTAPKEILFSQKIYPISAIDPTTATNASAAYYPGLRGANQLIIYTPSFGLRTGTNEFGSEAIVEGNVVTTISGADSIIPDKGLVISGHGNAKTWMNKNIMVGSKVYINKDSKTLTVYLTSDSFLFNARQKLKEAQNMVAYYKNLSYMNDEEKATEHITKAQEYLEKAEKHPFEVQRFATDAIKDANAALATAIPYKKDELKGVWIRPTETSTEQVINTLERIKAAGINNVFLETYFHGKTIFPSKTMSDYKFISENEKFAGFDTLRAWVDEAHKRNIKVHIWFETFYVGNDSPQCTPQSILAVKPAWGNKTKRDFNSLTAVPSISEHNGYFIDPANPDVQQFLENLITEIIKTYHPDGINLDYIRYPQSMSPKFSGYELSNWGYTEYARNDFKNIYGKDPVDICYEDPLWKLWAKYRQDKITAFVSRISCLTKENHMLLTTVIFPDRQKALDVKQQDWRTWSMLGYVDGFTPLLLTCDDQTANSMMRDVVSNKRACTNLYAGLFITFMGGSNEDLIRQIHEARKLDAKGIIIFDYAHLNNQYVNALTQSVFDPTQLEYEQASPCNTQPMRRKRHFLYWNRTSNAAEVATK